MLFEHAADLVDLGRSGRGLAKELHGELEREKEVAELVTELAEELVSEAKRFFELPNPLVGGGAGHLGGLVLQDDSP